jgi:hypothetical protein
VAAIYNPGPNEVYLQSRTVSVCLAYSPNPEPSLPLLPLQVRSWPNPFNPSTTVSFQLPEAGRARISVFNARGQMVKQLLDSELAAGEHHLIWNGTDAKGSPCASGVYLLRVESGRSSGSAKLLLLK